ncbi:MAG TPA: xanthine dehydrogenase family protein molybdopterin-binding subunit [Nitrospinae bacterium]|nr:xanthine dehydrogenase family protein molybdopterin-binding subunit [Nitrospinota bacterium]
MGLFQQSLGNEKTMAYRIVGKPIPRIDSAEQVAGEARFGEDWRPEGCLVAHLLLSPYPHARIRNLDLSRARKVPGVLAVVSAGDVPGGRYGRMIRDETLFASGRVRYAGERIAAVAAKNHDAAREAISRIRVEYEPLPVLLTPEEAMAEGAVLIHEELESYPAFPGSIRYGNVAARIRVHSGDVERGFSQADHIIEDTYHTPRVHQGYLEPRAVVAEPTENGITIVRTPTQAAFVVRALTAEILKIPLNAVRVICTHVGGAFGGKSQHLIEAVAVLLSRKTGRSVRLTLTREEDTLTGNPRHAYSMHFRSGVNNDGRLIARQVRLVSNNGAYCMSGPAVLGKSSYTCTGPYRIEHTEIESFLVYTNLPPSGSYRGLGVPQVAFACERHMDQIAHKLNIDPLELRLMNAMREGDTDPAGTRIQSVSLRETLERASEAIDWQQRDKSAGEPRGPGPDIIRRGFGIACARYPTGGGASGAVVKVNEDGGIAVLAGCSDLGTGAATLIAQVAAEVLGAEINAVHVRIADTETTPFDAISAGSRTTFNMCHAVRRAAEDARDQILDQAASMLETSPEDLEITSGRIAVRGAPGRSVGLAEAANAAVWSGEGPPTGRGAYRGVNPPHDPANVEGHPEPSRPGPEFATQVAEVDVNMETGEVRVVRIVSAQDVGFAINPLSLSGQIEGGIAQGLGFALAEELPHEGGHLLNAGFENMHVPTSLDSVDVVNLIVECTDTEGPYGAKGAGEVPLIPTAPAVANAIADAIRDPGNPYLNRLPLTPESVFKAIRSSAAPARNRG